MYRLCDWCCVCQIGYALTVLNFSMCLEKSLYYTYLMFKRKFNNLCDCCRIENLKVYYAVDGIFYGYV